MQQWLHLCPYELVVDAYTKDDAEFLPKGDRYDSLRICVGQQLLDNLFKTNLFMVGCGANGCENLKNLALIGVGAKGNLIVTDNDLIEKSNLNRQFLFRPEHIRKPKSEIAVRAVKDINPSIEGIAMQSCCRCHCGLCGNVKTDQGSFITVGYV